MITYDSKIKDLYSTPIGHDIVAKVLLQLGKEESLVTNPLVGNLKLGFVKKLTKKLMGDTFFDTLIELVNSEKDLVISKEGQIEPAWWKEAVFYQIYPRTFCDSNGDGIGDLQGIISKLDYLKELGVDALWLSPIYDSPNDDNGYDIRNYYEIMSEFGTMSDFDELLDEAHKRNIRLIMDLVINHTSDEHEWFQKALNEPDSKYRTYYYIYQGNKVRRSLAHNEAELLEMEKHPENYPPNNWTSFFSGSAWNYYPDQDLWALHLFSKKQMDLNWECPEMRNELYQMINFWLDKGVDGFRMDVINYISKNYLTEWPSNGLKVETENGKQVSEKGNYLVNHEENKSLQAYPLPMGDQAVGDLMGFTGIEHYFYGKELHNFLQETQNMTFSLHNAFSVGECPGLGMEMGKLVSASTRGELDMIFSFDHLETPGHIRLEDYEYDLNYYRDYIINWTKNYGSDSQMSLFYNNHDNPRFASKVSNDREDSLAIQKLLAAMQFTLRGTPFVYQGDEMGLLNYEFESIDQITDVEAKGYYNEHISQGQSPEEIMKVLQAGTREHARVLLPWSKYVDTSSCPDDVKKILGDIEEEHTPEYHQGLSHNMNPEMAQVYKEIIAFRKKHLGLIAYGDFKVLSQGQDRFVYQRKNSNDSVVVDCNLSDRVLLDYELDVDKWTLDFNYAGQDMSILEPYGVRIYSRKK